LSVFPVSWFLPLLRDNQRTDTTFSSFSAHFPFMYSCISCVVIFFLVLYVYALSFLLVPHLLLWFTSFNVNKTLEETRDMKINTGHRRRQDILTQEHFRHWMTLKWENYQNTLSRKYSQLSINKNGKSYKFPSLSHFLLLKYYNWQHFSG
jgi:hypothetical protein